MSSDTDGADRPNEIIVIKQLLQKLEEAAARDTQDIAPDAAIASTDTTLAIASALSLTPEQPPLLTLQRGTSVARLPDDSLPDFPRAPLSIDRPAVSSETALTTTPAALPLRNSRGFAIAAGSFVLGILAAGTLLVAFDPLSRLTPRPSSATVADTVADKPPAIPDRPAQVAADVGTSAPVEAREITPAKPPEAADVSARAAAPPDDRPLSIEDGKPPAAAELRVSEVAGASAPAAADAAPQPPASLPVAAAPPAAAAATAATAEPVTTKAEAPSPPVEQPVSSPPPARLQIPSQLVIRAGESRSLDARVDASTDEIEKLLLVLRNVPSWLTLTKGSRLGNDIWVLPVQQMSDVSIELAETARGATALKVQLARGDGSMIAEAELSIRAAPWRAPALSADLSLPQEQESSVARLQARGELLLDTGEVEAARTLLRTAAEAGSVEAALKLAETYDPMEIRRLGVTERSADLAMAVRWYEHAQSLGSQIATARLVALGRR
jgi:hypothetical protein